MDNSPLSPDVRRFLKAVASKSRQRVLLQFARGEELTVNEVAARTAMAQSTASEQLAQLRDGELVAARRDGRTTWYRADPQAITALLGDLSAFLRSCCPPGDG